MAYQNIRGLKTKLRYWRENLHLLDHDFVAVTETFLDSSVQDAELCSGGWGVIRRDRATFGGGVLIATRPGITLDRRRDIETDCGEDLWVSFKMHNVNVHLCVVYINPRVKDDAYMNWFHTVETNINDLKGMVIIAGDLNSNSSTLSIRNYYCYFLSICGMREMNNVFNSNGGKLDVVLVSERFESVASVSLLEGGLVPKPDAYHPPLCLSIPITINANLHKIALSNIDSSRDWNFPMGDYDILYERMSEVSWLSVYQAQNIDGAAAAFYNIIYNIFDFCIPRKIRSKVRARRYPVWFTRGIIKDLKLKFIVSRKKLKTANTIRPLVPSVLA
jgi:hypothetical protein